MKTMPYKMEPQAKGSLGSRSYEEVGERGGGMDEHFGKKYRKEKLFIPRSKHLLISWLQSPSTVILEPKKIISVTVSIERRSPCL